ncbi:RICIN domain-containing protein [Lentzea sp. NPDC004782]|uniref:RICIN domain-containing protein n=1 Tax=Lentzea sp. NPDC004782 TaxID=3154458 RepID=UPI0033B04691
MTPQSSHSAAGAQPPSGRPANDGLGYLLPSDNDRKAIDFYDNEHHDAVIWDRHPPGTDPSHQPHWMREFTGSGADPVRGDHVVANACSSGNAQLWRTRNTAQFTSVEFGGCLSVADNGSYDNGTWLYLANCADRPDQNWRLVR